MLDKEADETLVRAEWRDDSKPHDLSAAVGRGGMARIMDLVKWERLRDLMLPAAPAQPRFAS